MHLLAYGRFAAIVAWLALGSVGCGSSDDAAAGTGGSGGKTTTSKGGTGSGGTPGKPTTSGDTFGDGHTGQYHLGPVDFAETQWHNACAPGGSKYRPELQPTVGLSGEYLAGVANAYNMGGGVCDACILIETAKGKSIVARVVTYGVEQADGDIDVSPSVYKAIYQNEYPRTQTWHFARCPEAGNLQYEFQTGANPYWTSLWVRNPRVPLVKAEVQKMGAKDFVELNRAGDGTLTDPSGFGNGAFTFRLTAMDGQMITDELPGFTPGELVKSTKQFD